MVSGRPESDYFRFMQLVIRGFKDARMYHLKGFTKVAKLTVSDIKTIAIPGDYISFVAVVVPLQGEYWTLTEKDTLVFSQVGSTLVADDEEGEDINDSYTINYGATGGINRQGYIKLEEAENRIVINSLAASRTEVFLIYVSSGINEAGADTYLPDAIVPMLIPYVLWKNALYRGERYADFQEDYYRELDKVRYLQMPSIDVLLDSLYEVFTQTPQR